MPSLWRPVLDSLSQLNLSDIERIRLILNGDSVVDWSRLHCHTLDEVDALLLRVGLDVKTELNRVRLRRLHLQAIEYLDAHQFDLTADRIRSISDPRNLLLGIGRSGYRSAGSMCGSEGHAHHSSCLRA